MAGQPILVIGATGQLARSFAQLGSVGDHAVVCRGRPGTDLCDPRSLERTIGEIAPAIIVNAAAYTAVEKAEAEPAEAFAVNAEGAGHLARICCDRDLALIHMSTDFVFDGSSNTPYREDDPIAPLGVYGASKAAGEEAIRRSCPRHVILRTAWLYSMDGQNFLTTMLRLAETRDELSIVDDQHGTPTSTHDVSIAIATVVRNVIRARSVPPWGTYHLTARGATTWYGFASEIFRLAAAAGHSVPRLKPVTTAEYPTSVRRPPYSVLDCGKIAGVFGIHLPEWQDGLAHCFARGRRPALRDDLAHRDRIA